MKKLAIVSTHPIQYNAPLFKLLSESPNLQIKVFYTWSQARETVPDKDFGKEIKWDIPLLEGYNYEFLKNVSSHPAPNTWNGIQNPELNTKIEAFEPNAILVYGWNMRSHYRVMRHFKNKIPVWFRGDSTLLDETKGIKTLLRRILLRNIYKKIDKALYVGDENKKYFLIHGLKENNLILAPHAVDNQRFQDINNSYEDSARKWRSELGYQEDDVVILYAGKLEELKQPQLLIETFRKANKLRNGKLHLLLVGNGSLEKDIKTLTAFDNYIKLLSFQNQRKMPIVYRLGDLFALPSKSETWGLGVNEAMACGRPVLVSNKVGCSSDLVHHGNNGFIFNYNDKEELLEIFLNAEKENLAIMGTMAQLEIQKWNFGAIVNAIEKNL